MTDYSEVVDRGCIDLAEDLVAQRLPLVMAEHPDLNPSGYGNPEPYGPGGRYFYCATDTHDLMYRYVNEIAFAVCWLAAEGRIVQHEWTQNNTYGLKHRMADATGKYIGNGEMIAAFLVLDWPIQLDDFNPAVLVKA